MFQSFRLRGRFLKQLSFKTLNDMPCFNTYPSTLVLYDILPDVHVHDAVWLPTDIQGVGYYKQSFIKISLYRKCERVSHTLYN